nr:PREDICTED: proteoglycan 4 [Lepisosteus oculatus]
MTASPVYAVLIIVFSCLYHPLSAAIASCNDRCGESYYRGDICHCDYDCLLHKECCSDYEAFCTTVDSCKGRCGETFQRGKQCYCDVECSRYNQCCPDYRKHCTIEIHQKPGMPPTIVPITTRRSTTHADSRKQNIIEATKIKPTKKLAVKSLSLSKKAFPTKPTRMMALEPAADSESSENEDIIKDLTDSQLLPLPNVPGNKEPAPEQEPQVSLINSNRGRDLQGDEAKIPDGTVSTETTPPAKVQKLLDSTLTNPFVLKKAEKPQASAPVEADKEEGPAESVSGFEPLVTSSPDVTVAGLVTLTPLSSMTTHSGKPSLGPGGEGVKETLEGTYAVFPTEGKVYLTSQTEIAAANSSTGLPSPVQSSLPPTRISDDEVKPSAVTAQTPVATEDLAKSTVSPVPDDEVKLPAVTPQSPVGTEDLAKSTMSPEPENIASQTTAHNGVPSSVSVGVHVISPTEGIKDMFTLTHTSVHTSLPEPSERPERLSFASAVPADIPVPSTSSGTVTIQSTVPSKHPSDSVGENNDTNICSGRPANALTTLQNGTMIVFRGHFFWTFGSNGALGHPRRITEEWGIPSPIDTVFTRCNCQGKTFIFKANEYWRFDNGVMDRGYPKLISKGFGGMSGRITAALSVPAFGKRREAVYFFKRGGLVQKYSYKQEPSQSCGKPQTQYRIYSLHSRITRQAGPVYLGKEINIKLTWKGFPTSVTSAISLPNSKKPDGYDYFVFSRAKYYNIIINSDQPAVTPLLKSVTHKDTAKDWYHCP